MARFQSNDELFQAVNLLISQLDGKGQGAAAARLRDGYACLNGLTDGWALFLDSIDDVRSSMAEMLDPGHRKAIDGIRAAVHKAVHRR